MRPGLRGIVGLPDAYGDAATAAAGYHCRMAVGVHCQRQRAWRFDFPGRQQRQGHRPLDHRCVAQFIVDAFLGVGADPIRRRFHRADDYAAGGAALFARTAVNGGTIEIADLVVRYDAVPAVNGVSFTVAQGEHVTLLGPSGCGKTTTLRAIAGLEQPVGGSIRIDGETVFSAAQRRNVPTEKRGVSMVFQSYAVWPHMSVAENVAYGLRVRKLPKVQIAEAVERALELVQMRALAGRSAALLSGGQQQRVALARAIAFSPTVLLFDEPLSNLDAKLRAEMRVELRALQRRLGVTYLYVTHDQA